jgi:CHAT domain-containing protein/Tfp pilus assembly protein PilF
MSKRIVAVSLFMLVCSGLSSGVSRGQVATVDPYESALKLVGLGQYEGALAALEELVATDPAAARAAQKIVEISRYLRQTERARAIFERLLGEKRTNAAALHGLSVHDAQQGHWPEAFDNARKAVDLCPRCPLMFQAMVNAADQLKRLTEAEALISGLAAKDPANPAAAYGLAYLSSKRRTWDEALERVEKAIGLDPREPLYARLKCDIYDGQGRNKDLLALATDCEKRFAGSDPDLRIDFYTRASSAYSDLGQYSNSFAYNQKALDLAREIGNKRSEGIILGNIGVYHAMTGHLPEAVKFFHDKLAVMEELGERAEQANALSNIGAIYDWQGDVPRSLESYGAALKILEGLDDKRRMAVLTGNMGAAFEKLSDYPKALDSYRRALTVFQELQDKGDTAWMLGNIAAIATKLGDDRQALDDFGKALAIMQEIGNRKYEGWILGTMGTIYKHQGDKAKSYEYLGRALEIAREIGDGKIACDHLANIGSNYLEDGEFEKAGEYLGQALDSAEKLGNKVAIVEAHLMLGILGRDQKDYDRALREYRKALELGTEIAVPRLVWNSEWGLANAYEKEGRLEEALGHYTSAVDTVEKIRGKLVTQEQKVGFLGQTIDIYESLIRVLFKLREKGLAPDGIAESYHLAERAKSRAFLELLAETKIDLAAGLSQDLESAEKSLEVQLTGIQQKLQDPSLKRQDREALYAELGGVESKYQEFIRELRMKSPEYAAAVYPEPLTLPEVQRRVLDKDTYLVEFFFGADDVFQWVASKDRILWSRSLPRAHPVFKKIQDYASQISRRKINLDVRMAKEIYDVLMKDALREVPARARLLVVPDGPLLRLPFEALVKDLTKGAPRYLLEYHTFLYAPSASALAEMTPRRSPGPARPVDLFALGNPAFDTAGKETQPDLEYLRAGAAFQPLPYAEEEVSSIGRLYRSKKKDAEVFVKEDARESLLKSGAGRPFKVLHLATHGFVDDRIPALSGLLLAPGAAPDGEDGFLRLNEIFQLKLGADLVILSACETALGKEVRGEGMIGLTRAFFYAGARSVVASLWMVSDRSTALLMREFHAHLLDGEDAPAALRRAKLGLLKSKDPRFRHPFFWAPFIVIGRS